MFRKCSYEQQLRFNLNRQIRQKQIENLKFLLNYGIQGHAFIYVLLKLIDLQKELFVLDLELGSHVYIPKYLSMRQFSIAFRYYDPLINIAKDKGDPHKKEHFSLSCLMNMQRIHQESIRHVLFHKM